MKSQKTQKIMYVITKSNYGGAQKYVHELAGEVKNRSFDVSVACGPSSPSDKSDGDRARGNGNLKEKLKSENIKVIDLKNLGYKVSLLSDLQAFFELHSLFRQKKPNIVHLNSSKAGAIGVFAARLAGISKIIFTIHGWAFNEKRNWLSKFIIKFIYAKIIFYSHHSIAVSEQTAEQAKKLPCYSLFRKKISVVRNAIKPIDFIDRESAREFIFSKSKAATKIVGTIAELHPIKGLSYLIDAAEDVIEGKDDTIFVILGEGKDRERLEKLIKEKNVKDKVFLLGFVDRAAKYLKAFDVFVLPSLSEGYPLSIEEAKQSGIPIVSTDVGGVSEALSDYKNKKVVQSKNTAKDSNDLENAILEFLDKEFDPENYQSNFDQMVEKTIGIYNK